MNIHQRPVPACAIALIKKWEGLHDGDKRTPILEPEADPIGIYTIGWGHALFDKLGKPVRNRALAYAMTAALYPAGMTRADADALLQVDAQTACDHVVPLSRQAKEVIEAARTMSGLGPYVFPNYRNAHRPMTEGAMRLMLAKAGFQDDHVAHGWRSTFSTVMNELYPGDRHIIDLMLAHKAKDEVEAAYNRALHLGRRTELAQLWADLICHGLQPAANLLPAR